MGKDTATNNERGTLLSGSSLSEALVRLRNLPILATLDEHARAVLTAGLTVRAFRPGAFVVKYAEPGDSCFVIIEGVVSARRMDARGKELTYRSLSAGELFGEVALLTGQHRTTDIIAEQPSIIAHIPADTFRALLAAAPEFSFHVLTSLAERFRTNSERLSDLSFLDLNQRLFQELSRLAIEVELGGETRILVRELPSRQHLASLLSCTREAVSRALKQLEEQGLIVLNKDQVELKIRTLSR